MRNCAALAFSLFSLAAPGAFAQEAGEWLFVRSGEAVAGWAPSTLTRAPDGGAVSIERFIAYPSRQATGDVSYSVVVETVDFRCADHLMKIRDSVFYSDTLEPNGNGYAEDWTATPQSGPDAVLNAVA
ncbi:MAG: hypothetical protein R3C52_16170, partial [Hyphomonadaceae bacterium]